MEPTLITWDHGTVIVTPDRVYFASMEPTLITWDHTPRRLLTTYSSGSSFNGAHVDHVGSREGQVYVAIFSGRFNGAHVDHVGSLSR